MTSERSGHYSSPGGLGEPARELTRYRVLETLRVLRVTSRAEIARRTGLSRATVSAVVADLLAHGLVVQGEDPPAAAAGRSGRPPVRVSLAPAAGAALGIDIGHRHVRVAVADLSHRVLAEAVLARENDHDAAGALDAAVALADRVLAEAGIARERLLGAGVGIAAPVERRSGRVHAGRILPDWEGVRIVEELERRLGTPVRMDNDANAGAAAELAFGAGRDASDLVYIRLSAGIGAGIVLGGSLHRGAGGTAGEIGHLVVDASGPVCRCGNRGCLETLAGPEALGALLEPMLGRRPEAGELVELALAGDAGAGRVIGDAGRLVGTAVAGLCNLLNPSLVLVGGELAQAGELLLEPLRAAVALHAVAPAVADVEVRAGTLGERAEVLGAIALVLADAAAVLAARPAAPAPAA